MIASQKLKNYCYLVRLNKPIGILLLLWPTLWALILASCNHFRPYIFFVFIAGVILMRSAGCAINDLADHEFDGHVARTRDRPLVRGNVSPKEALILFFILSGIAFALVLTLNLLTILLAIPAVLLAASYPFMKRIMHFPQLILGLAFSWGIPMAFAALLGFVPSIAWILMLANILWTIAYDTEYAMVDREDDIKIGIKSTAITFGHYDRFIIGVLQATTICLLLFIGFMQTLHSVFYVAVSVAALLAVYQQYLLRHRNPTDCFKAFLNNNWFGLVITVGMASSVLP